ncbi:hypothetical protein F0562_015446 [Nyssa sinensis]|uniref:Uncharacterized protein n=1 Tax=Nyssa sinensis TaxID=561372 RepID=A0A5J4ZKF6_9ASTE|nr:hypothetical protein F0562_015446 [Nyssa sinensis]
MTKITLKSKRKIAVARAPKIMVQESEPSHQAAFQLSGSCMHGVTFVDLLGALSKEAKADLLGTLLVELQSKSCMQDGAGYGVPLNSHLGNLFLGLEGVPSFPNVAKRNRPTSSAKGNNSKKPRKHKASRSPCADDITTTTDLCPGTSG